MIKLDSNTNIDSLERAYESFPTIENCDLLITKELDTFYFGLTPAIILFFARWNQFFPNCKIVINTTVMNNFEDLRGKELEEYSDKILGDFYKHDYLFTALVYCWNHEIEDIRKKNLKPLLKIQNEKQQTIMRKQSLGGGFKTILSCFDQLGTKKGLLPAFYTDGEFIDNEVQFDFAIEKSIRKVISLNSDLKNTNYVPNHSDLVAIIYELIKNTDNWGKTDINNKPIKPNNRGLYMKTHRRKQDSFVSGFSGHEGLKSFFSADNFQATTAGELYFLELSVFDTGIGFVNRYTKRSCSDFNPAEQVDIVKNCLILNNTSAIGIEKHSKGKGLARIMNILNNRGFFWIRTGNISVFRNLIANNHDDKEGIGSIKLFDWKTNSDKNFTNLSTVNGSIVTLVYPLSNTKHV